MVFDLEVYRKLETKTFLGRGDTIDQKDVEEVTLKNFMCHEVSDLIFI